MKSSQTGSTPFSQLLGMRCLEREKGRARYELEVGPEHLNRRGVAHGGVVASLLDTALGASVVSTLTPEEWTGTLELSVQFREPVRPGVAARVKEGNEIDRLLPCCRDRWRKSISGLPARTRGTEWRSSWHP